MQTRMPTDGDIIVSRGARLIVDGGTITHNKTMWDECSAAGKWGTIWVHGNPNAAQSAVMQDPVYTQSNSDPGILLLFNATIEHASDAIACVTDKNPFLQSFGPSNGGLVYARNSIFRNNVYGAYFGSYQYRNWSAFETCQFLNEDGTANYGARGEGTFGIAFFDCAVKNMNGWGLMFEDGGITVKKSLFEENHHGIEVSATKILTNNTQIGGGPDPFLGDMGNTFKNNAVAINATNLNRLFIEKNIFDGNDFGIALYGDCDSEVYDNRFENSVSAGMDLVHVNGFGYNLADCNDFENEYIGIDISGQSTGFEFKQNEFITTYDVILSDEDGTAGEISSHGSQGNAYWNYFSANNIQHINTIGNTVTFDYFHPNPSINARLKPKCDLNDQNCPVAPNNFYNHQTFGGSAVCLGTSAPGGGEPPCVTRECLEQIRLQIASLEQVGNPTEAQIAELRRLRFQKTYVLDKLLGEALDVQDFAEAEDLLAPETSKESKRKRLGVKLAAGNISGAYAVLASYPNTTLDDQYFVTVQNINIRRLDPATTELVLTSTEQETLTAAANSKLPSAGYARALKQLLYDSMYEPDIPEEVQERSQNGFSQSPVAFETLQIFPVPADDYIDIRLPKEMVSPATLLRIVDMQGAVKGEIYNPDQQVRFQTSQLPSGTYAAFLLKDGKMTARKTFFVVK